MASQRVPGEAVASAEKLLQCDSAALIPALRIYTEAVLSARARHASADEVRALKGQGKCFLALGRIADARQSLRSAYALAKRLGSSAELQDVRKCLKQCEHIDI